MSGLHHRCSRWSPARILACSTYTSANEGHVGTNTLVETSLRTLSTGLGRTLFGEDLPSTHEVFRSQPSSVRLFFSIQKSPQGSFHLLLPVTSGIACPSFLSGSVVLFGARNRDTSFWAFVGFKHCHTPIDVLFLSLKRLFHTREERPAAGLPFLFILWFSGIYQNVLWP